MALLAIGLSLFLGVHSVRIFAPAWRDQMIARIGDSRWRGLYSLLAAAGLVERPRRNDRPAPPEALDAAVDVRLDRVVAEVRGG